MKCSHCGANIPDNINFCTKCGNAVERPYNNNTDEMETSVLNQQNNPFNQNDNNFEEKTTTGWSDNQPQYQQNPPQYQTPPQYQVPPQYPTQQPASVNVYNMANTEAEPVSIGGWIGVYFLSLLPLVNLIMLFVWAFSSSTKPSLKNYARAMLILAAIALAVFLILFLIIFLFTGNSIFIFHNSR